jgi:hypothetical protein
MAIPVKHELFSLYFTKYHKTFQIKTVIPNKIYNLCHTEIFLHEKPYLREVYNNLIRGSCMQKSNSTLV